MKVTFLGTGAAEGFPAVFCKCKACEGARALGAREYRTRMQVLIDNDLSIDFPPDAYYHALQFGVDLSVIKTLLVTHSHMDHFYAHDFILRGYKYATVLSEPKLSIYGNSEVCKVYEECTARELKPVVAPNLSMHQVSALSHFTVEEYEVYTLPARHSQTEEALLYFVAKDGKGYLHLCDTGLLPEAAYTYLAQNALHADLVTFDCTFADGEGGETARHMGMVDILKVKKRLTDLGVCGEKTKYVLTHFSHNCNPLRANLAPLEQKYNMIAAYDGFTIEI